MITSKKNNIYLKHLLYFKANIPQDIQSEVKNKIKTIYPESCLYSQVVNNYVW